MSEQETMEAWMKLAALGKEHEMLGKYAGDWNVTVKMWMSPSDPPAESKGTARWSSILGGRVMTEEFRGDNMMGMTFEGHGMMGYDNFRSRWWLSWNDNMSTGMFNAQGTASPDGKTITMTGLADRIAQNRKDILTKVICRFPSPDRHLFEYFDVGSDGKEIKTLEIEYRRK